MECGEWYGGVHVTGMKWLINFGSFITLCSQHGKPGNISLNNRTETFIDYDPSNEEHENPLPCVQEIDMGMSSS